MRLFRPKKKIECEEINLQGVEKVNSSSLFPEKFDIEDLLHLIDELPPRERYGKQRRFNVTDFSAQLWCEKQLEFTLATGLKRETAQMRYGSERHAALELSDHESIEIEVTNREDYLGLTLMNTIQLLEHCCKSGKAREIWLFGVYEDVIIRGYVDELAMIYNEQGQKQVKVNHHLSFL